MVIFLQSVSSRLSAASAALPAVWCIDSSHLLRQETLRNVSLSTHIVTSPSQPRHSIVGAATLAAAGDSTMTWTPIHRDGDQINPTAARAARTQKNGDHFYRQNRAASNSTLRSIVELKKTKNSVERLCALQDFDGEQGPGTAAWDWSVPIALQQQSGGVGTRMAGSTTWDRPLMHREDTSNDMDDLYSLCSMTAGNSLATPGYWFVKFADGNLRNVSRIRLWDGSSTRVPRISHQMDNACVRFTTSAAKPSTLEPSENCDLYLPSAISGSSGPGSGTDVAIGREITGMMLISNGGAGESDFFQTTMTICGIEIYEELTTTETCTEEQEEQEQAEQAGIAVGLVIGGAVLSLAAVGAAFAMGIIQFGGAPQPTDAAPDAY